MKRRLMAVLATMGAACGLLTTSPAHAQRLDRPEFGDRGEFIVSADRLVSLFSFSRVSEGTFGSPAGVTETTSDTQSGLSFLWGSALPQETFFTIPRVGFDYVVIPRLTIGGDVAVFFTVGGNHKTEIDNNNNGVTQTNSTTSPSNTVFGLAPRVGYILGLNNMFSFWLRGGFSFYTESQKTTNTDNAGNTTRTTTDGRHQFALDLDPQFVITPVPHVGFTVGLTADIPLAGGLSQEVVAGNNTQTNTVSSSVLFIGITGGMLVYF